MKTSSVKLVAITQGLGELAGKSAQDIIAYVARVSNPNNQNNFETAPKLLSYLIKNAHWSPFENVSFTVEIETSRGIAAQILRHRSFVFQEFSQRYAKVSEFIKYPARSQDAKNRQNSIDNMSEEDRKWFDEAQERIGQESFKLYNEALSRSIAKEQARFLLPLNTKTRLYMTGSVRSWIHYTQLRSKNGTQLEHAEIAIAVKDIMKTEFPDIYAALWSEELDTTPQTK